MERERARSRVEISSAILLSCGSWPIILAVSHNKASALTPSSQSHSHRSPSSFRCHAHVHSAAQLIPRPRSLPRPLGARARAQRLRSDSSPLLQSGRLAVMTAAKVPTLDALVRKLTANTTAAPADAAGALSLDWDDETAIAALRQRALASLRERLQRESSAEDEKKEAEEAVLRTKEDWRSAVNYIDPFTPAGDDRQRRRRPRARLSEAEAEDEDRRWQELERREESEQQKAKTEEKKEAAVRPASTVALSKPLLSSASSSSSPHAPLPASSSSSSASKLDFRWLVKLCSGQAASGEEEGGMSSLDLASSALQLLQSSRSDEQLQSELLDLLGLEKLDAIAELLRHRQQLRGLSKGDVLQQQAAAAAFLSSSSSSSPSSSALPVASGGRHGPPQLLGVSVVSQQQREQERRQRKEDRRMARHSARDTSSEAQQRQRQVDQQRLEEQAASLDEWRTASIQAKANALPAGSRRVEHKGYEEVFIPPLPTAAYDASELIPITALDAWSRAAFPGTTHLNRIQSRCFTAAYRHNNNLLVAAPTGAGKVCSQTHNAHARSLSQQPQELTCVLAVYVGAGRPTWPC